MQGSVDAILKPGPSDKIAWHILNANCQLKVEIAVMNGFSGHAGRLD
jgi:hypothetical protein